MRQIDEVGTPDPIAGDDDDLGLKIERDMSEAMDLLSKWREEARDCFDAYASHQWDEDYLYDVDDLEKVAFVFNRSAPFVDAVAGTEMNNKREVSYTPVQQGDAVPSEIMTRAAEWVSDQTGAEFEHSDAFKDMLTCGVGATLTSLSYDEDPDGKIEISRLDPLMLYWDPSAKKRNAKDKRWVAHVTLPTLEELKDLYGDDIVDRVIPSKAWGEWLDNGPSQPYHSISDWLTGRGNQQQTGTRALTIPVIEYFYWKRVKRYQVSLPEGGTEVVSEAAHRKLRKQVSEDTIDDFRSVQVWGREWMRAVAIGRYIAESGPAATGHWQINMMTGRRDRQINSWYGILRPLLGPEESYGPQHLVNSLYTEMLDIIASNSKGGLLAESDAFENPQQAEDRWSSGKSIIWLNSGAIAGQKIMEKPSGNYPTNLDRMMQWAVESFPQVAGVSWEMLGLADREQPGVLEAQRKQSGFAILADFFDARRQYAIEHGRMLVEMILEYYAGEDEKSSRLMLIAEEGQEKYIPMLRSQFSPKYDVTVDESPTSPNQKQQTWGVLQNLLPFLMKAGLPITPEVIEYLPLPQKLIEKWKELMEQGQQQQQAQQQMMQAQQQLQEQMQQLEAQRRQADMALTQAKTEAERADIRAEQEKIQQGWEKLQIERDKLTKEIASTVAEQANPERYRDIIGNDNREGDNGT